MGQSVGAPRGAQCPLESSSSRTLEISLKSIKARNVSLPCNSLSGQCCRRPGQILGFLHSQLSRRGWRELRVSGGEQGQLGESTVCQFGTTEENFGTEKGTGGTKGPLSTRCSQGGGEKHLLYGGGGARPICAQPRVGSHPIPAVEEEAGRKEGTPVNRQLSARASEKGGHCEQAAAAPQKSRFQNFKQVEQQRSAPVQQQPRREQAYFQPAPQQPVQPAYQQPAFKQQTFQQPQQPQRAAYQQPAYQQQQAYQQPQQVAAYPRAQHQTYTQEYILEANNNAQRIYSYTADKYQAKTEGGSYSYAAIY